MGTKTSKDKHMHTLGVWTATNAPVLEGETIPWAAVENITFFDTCLTCHAPINVHFNKRPELGFECELLHKPDLRRKEWAYLRKNTI